MNKEINALITIAYRDWLLLLRDKMRLVSSFIFPAIFIGVLGVSLQQNLNASSGFNLLTFVFIGVLAQSLFQSTASGVISLIEDRQTDFSQIMFVSPVSRYSIIAGKIIGESAVALTQSVGIFIIGSLIGVPLDWFSLMRVLPALLVACLLGGSFGVIIVSNLNSHRLANQIFTFLIFPQFFLAGVFAPIKNLPLPLLYASRAAPMTYAVDFIRGVYYWGKPEYHDIVLHHPIIDLSIISAMIFVFITIGTILFVRNERNR